VQVRLRTGRLLVKHLTGLETVHPKLPRCRVRLACGDQMREAPA
jgi:hypothetical protein